jgi:hypothetical protein
MFGLVRIFGLTGFYKIHGRGGGGSEIPAPSRVKATNESDSGEATAEAISHTEGLEALERALLYVEQHSKATPTDVIL